MRALLGGAAGLLLLIAASEASAQTRRTAMSDWRQRSRPDSEGRGSSQNFAFELRFGAYSPRIDDEFGGPGPYAAVFGEGPQFYIGLEMDWLPLRIPYIGVVGPGLGWGWTRTSAKARLEGTDQESGQDTSLTIMPMHLSAVIRVDELMRRTGIPIVPFAKLGLGMGTWSAGTSTGTSEHDGVVGEGISWGTHFALGAALSLGFLDRRSEARLDESAGINHVYVFGEWMNANLDGIGSRPQMRIGTSTWVAGLAFDF